MADFNSDQVADRFSVGFPGTPGFAGDYNGRVRSFYAKFTGGVSTLAQNDRIYLGDLPVGARVNTVMARHGAFGASVTLDIGTTATENLFLSAANIAAAGVINAPSLSWATLVAPAADPEGPVVPIYAKFEGANPADSVDLEVMLYWTID